MEATTVTVTKQQPSTKTAESEYDYKATLEHLSNEIETKLCKQFDDFSLKISLTDK